MQSLLAWQLGPATRGQYALCLVLISIFSTLLLFGTDWSTRHYLAKWQDSTNRLITFALAYCCVACLAAIVLIPFVFQLDLKFFAHLPSDVVLPTVFWCCSNIFFLISFAILGGLSQFRVLAILSLVKPTLTLSLATLMLFGTQIPELISPIFADTISALTVSSIVLVLLVRSMAYRWMFPNVHLIKTHLDYCRRFFLGSFGMIVNAHISLIVISIFITTEQIGYFSLAFAFLSQLISITDVVNNVLQPRVASSMDGRPRLIALSSRTVSSVAIVLGALIIWTGESWIPLLFSEKFNPTYSLLVYLLPGIWLRMVGKSLFPYFNGINKPEIVSTTTLINLSANIIFLFILTPIFELKGAAVAITLSYAISTGYIVSIYCKLNPVLKWSLALIKPADIKSLYDSLLK